MACSRIPLSVWNIGLLFVAPWFGCCYAQDYCTNGGRAIYNGACYIFADQGVSCTDKCVAEGASCNEDALELTDEECEGALNALGVILYDQTTSDWYYNFGPDMTQPSFQAWQNWQSSVFDENSRNIAIDDRPYLVAGCLVSPTFDATDQASATTSASITAHINADALDAAEAHNFGTIIPPTCDGGESPLYRRVCSCFFTAPSPTPSPTPPPTTPTPTPGPTPTPTPGPTPAPTPGPTPAPTPGPTTTPSPTPSPTPTSPQTTPYPTPSTPIIAAGYWRTSEASTDVRVCPIPDLCIGGVGGGDGICLGDNTGPYCLVCPTSHYVSVNGVCLECKSSSGVTAAEITGMVLATCLLLGAPTFVGSVNLRARTAGNGGAVQKTSSLLNASTVQQSTTKRLRQKLLEVEKFVAFLRHDVLHTLPELVAPQVQDLLVTVEMFTVKLGRLLSRAPYPETGPGMKKAVMQSELLCPVIDQLASALAGLSGAASGEQATVVLQIKSSLVTARALDPSVYLPNLPVNHAANGAKVVLSFAQVIAATPLALVVRRSNTLRSFLGGLDMVNFTVPKAFSATCLVHGTFYGELVFKTIAPLGVAVVIIGVRTFVRFSCFTDSCTWRARSVKCNECLLALTYFVLIPAINAALRTLSCESFDDGRTMLRADYSIDCNDAEHPKYRALAVVMAVAYPTGVLALYSGVLWKHRHLLYPSEIHGRPKEDDTIAEEAKRVNALTLQPFALLHDAYEPRAWWYEIFETCRRILLASLGYFATRTSMQLWIAMGFTVLSLVMNVVFSPFVEIMHDSLYSSAQISAFVVLALALMAETEEHEDDETPRLLAWVMTVVMAGYVIAALGVLVMQRGARTPDGIQHDFVPRWAPLGVSVDESNEEHRPSLPPPEEGCQSQPTPVQRVGASGEFEALICSPPGSGDEGIRSKTTDNATQESTSGPTSLSQAQSRRTQIEYSARRNQDHSAPATMADAYLRAKKSARARSLAGINMRKATVALTDDDEPCREDYIQQGEPNV